jgi:hypothetical protein
MVFRIIAAPPFILVFPLFEVWLMLPADFRRDGKYRDDHEMLLR